MRWATLVMAAVMACSSAGGARRAPPPHALAACVGTLRELAGALAEPSDRLMRAPIGRRPWAAGLSCAGLYREPVCAEAWRTAFTASDAAPAADDAPPDAKLAPLLAACARAYCPRLRTRPAACTRPEGDPGAQVAQLVELDGAILEHEGVSPAVAGAIAGRAKLLASVSVTVDLPAAPAVEP